MSLRIIIKSDQIRNWIEERRGTPARRRNTDTDLTVLFGGDKADYEPVSVDDLLEAMRFNRLVLLVDQEVGNNYHRFIQHG
jgi:hypothetical protein